MNLRVPLSEDVPMDNFVESFSPEAAGSRDSGSRLSKPGVGEKIHNPSLRG